MQQFISSVRASISSQNWFSALFMALTMPDICGALEYGSNIPVGTRYSRWFDNYLKTVYSPKPLSLDEFRIKVDRKNEWNTLTAQELLRLETDLASQYEIYLLREQVVKFTSSDCYKFRCKSLHQGISTKDNGKKIMFSPPPLTGISIHKMNIKGIYFIDISVFCEDMCQAVERWLIDTSNNTQIQQGLVSLMDLDSYAEFIHIIED